MKKQIVLSTIAALMLSTPLLAEVKPVIEYPKSPARIGNETEAEKAARLAWWVNDRFGMFIHFGLYATLGRHEWVKSKERIAYKDYDELLPQYFNPDLFDAREWVRRAKAAGMKYMVLTAKHHEGFCMWDTKTTDFKITNTPFKRDLIKEYVEACRAEGMKVGLYFSIIDWHHPKFVIDHGHPLRPEATLGEGFKNDEQYIKVNEGRDMKEYQPYMFEQVRELLTNYGKIDILWFDYTTKGRYGKTWQDWDAVNLLKLARSLQPWLLIDNRLGLDDTEDGGDFVTPEQFNAPEWPKHLGKRWPWETCQTFSGSWGYYRDELTWKSQKQLLEILINAVSHGGNLIMNVGPTARGEFDYRAIDRLEGFSKWMHVNSRSIYGCGQAPEGFKAPNGTMLTYNAKLNRLYIHVTTYPMGGIPIEFRDKVAYAQFLHDGSQLKITDEHMSNPQSGDMKIPAMIMLPVVKPPYEVPVIEVFLK